MSADDETGEVHYQDEKPDLTDVDDVWINSESVPGEQFVEALDAVDDLQRQLRLVRDELQRLDTGLDRDDTIRLIKGRNLGWALDDIEAFFDTVDVIIESEPADIAPRLIHSKVSGMTIEEAAELFEDFVDLAEKYGSLEGQTEDDDG